MKNVISVKLVYKKEKYWNANYIENFLKYLGIHVWTEVLAVSNRMQESFDALLYVGEKNDNVTNFNKNTTIFLHDFISLEQDDTNLYLWNKDELEKLLLKLIEVIFDNGNIKKDIQDNFKN